MCCLNKLSECKSAKLIINKFHGENFKKISCCRQKSILRGLKYSNLLRLCRVRLRLNKTCEIKLLRSLRKLFSLSKFNRYKRARKIQWWCSCLISLTLSRWRSTDSNDIFLILRKWSLQIQGWINDVHNLNNLSTLSWQQSTYS